MPRWKRTVDIKKILRSGQTYDVISLRIADKLLNAFGSPDEELADIIEDFKEPNSVEGVDYNLSRLYDWADTNRVWLGL